MVTIDTSADMEVVITMDESATIYQAEEIADQLLPLIHIDKNLRIDLAQVNQIDSSVIQLLFYLQHQRQRLSLVTALENASEAVHSSFRMLGMQSILVTGA